MFFGTDKKISEAIIQGQSKNMLCPYINLDRYEVNQKRIKLILSKIFLSVN
jgi:hypothetical protein